MKKDERTTERDTGGFPRIKWSLIFPLVLLQIAEAGFAVAFFFGGIGYAVKSLIYIIPIIIADFCLWFRGRTMPVFKSISPGRLSFSNLILLTVFLFVLSIIILLIYPTRPWVYFIIVSLISGLIFTQIQYERHSGSDYLIISEIALLSLNLIWGVSLTYPLYFGSTDTLVHLSYIETIVQTGSIAGIGIDYINYPLFHIFNAMGVEIANLSLRTSLFIFMGISWQVGILFAYLIFRTLSNSRVFSLTACLLFALSSEIIYYGSYAVTRSLAFVFVLCLLYLILQKAHVKYVLFSILTIATLIIMHHATVLFLIPVLVVFYIFQNFFNDGESERPKVQSIGVQLLIIGFFVYTFYVSYAFSIPTMQVWVSSLGSAENSAPGVVPPAALVTSLYYSFVLFFVFIGVGVAISRNKSDDSHRGIIGIGLLALLLLFFYVPGPIDLLPQSGTALLYRLPLIVSPFIVYMLAYGINRFGSFELTLSQHIFKWYAPIPFLTLLLVVLTTFFSLLCGGNASDNRYILKASATNTPYFTNAELISFSFLKLNGNHNMEIYGDYETSRNEFYFKDFASARAIQSGAISYIARGYLLFRSGELERAGSLSFARVEGNGATYRYYPQQTNPQEDILANLYSMNRVYDSSDVQLYVLIPAVNSPQ